MKRTILAAAFILAAAGALAGPQTRPANAAATRPARQAGYRAKALKANLDSFGLYLSYLAVKKEQSAAASFSILTPSAHMPKGHRPGVRINKAQALAIIDHLDKSGVLSRLLDPQTEAIIDMAIPMPHLHVQVIAGKHSFQNWLPIDPKAVELVEALGKLLDGDAGKAMDKVIKALEPQRKKWQNQADLEAAARILTKTVGGTWRTRLQYAGKDAPIALYGTMGQQDKSGLWPLWYVVFAFGRGDTASQQLLLETYTYNRATILGAGDKYTVLQRGADAKAAVKHSPAVVKALGLQPPGMTLAAYAAKQVKTGKFMLSLAYKGPRGKGYRGLTLRVPKVADRGTPMDPALQISAEQAGRIVEALSKAGYFHRARPYAIGALEPLRGPAYVVQVIDGRRATYAVIGWNPETLGFLQTVRKALDGDAGKAMDKVIKALEPQRKKWQKAAATQPGKAAKLDLDATVKLLTKRVGGKWRKGAHNAFLPTKRVVRGRIYAATDKVRVSYTVYPLELFEGRTPVLSTLRMCGNAKILGVSPACVVTVFSTAPADKVAPYSRAVTKALGLKPPKVTRRVCITALRKMQKDFAAVAAKHPKVLGHLGPGTIDEKKLLLRFPVKNLPKTTQPAQRATPAGRMRAVRPRPDELGLFVQFTVPMSPKAGAGRWLHLNVSFAWRWMWPNRLFSWNARQDLMKMLSQAVVPLNELENATIAADLAKRPKGSYVLRGRAGVKLTIRLSPSREAAGTIVDLYATNQTKKVVALYPPFTQIIGDGKPWHYRAHGSLSMLTRAFRGDRDPFIYIKPGQTAKVGTVVVAGLSAGRHTVRVAAGHPCDYWVDVRPTFHDGPPIARKVPGAWTGVLVSGELTIDIPTPAAAKKKAAERAKLLKKTGTVYLVLQYHVGYIGARPSLHLATTNYKIELVGGILASLTPKEAANIIDHLAREGFLGQAENVLGKDIAPPQGPAYTLTLMGAGRTKLYQVLAWDLKMLGRLEGLRKVLAKDSAAGKAMDKVIKALDPQRKKWEKAAASKPAAKRQAESPTDFQPLFTPADRRRIQAMTGEQVLKIIKSEKDFCRLFEAYYWCELHRGAIAGDLVALLTKSREIGLTNSAELIIWERVKSGHLKYRSFGRIVDDDLFTVAGRASWLLKAMTGRNPGTVTMKSTAQDLAALSARWRAIVAPRAAVRAAALKKNLRAFRLSLRYHGRREKIEIPYRWLTLLPRLGPIPSRAFPHGGFVNIDERLAGRIIELLVREGFLGEARDVSPEGLATAVKKIESSGRSTYTLTVAGGGLKAGHVLYHDLGWDAEMLRRLDALGQILYKGGAEMDRLLKALKPLRRKWRAVGEPVRMLRGSIAFGFECAVRYFGPQGRRPYISLRLTRTPPVPVILPSSRLHLLHHVQITKVQALKIVDHLAAEGFFERAVQGNHFPRPGVPAYTLTVVSGSGIRFCEPLGWDLKMLNRLDALRKVLDKDSDAAKAMDKVIKALEPQRKKWQKPAAGKAATLRLRLSLSVTSGQVEFINNGTKAYLLDRLALSLSASGKIQEIPPFPKPLPHLKPVKLAPGATVTWRLLVGGRALYPYSVQCGGIRLMEKEHKVKAIYQHPTTGKVESNEVTY